MHKTHRHADGSRVGSRPLCREGKHVSTSSNQDALPGFKAAKPKEFRIVFDGGSRGNPGKGYGSYEITSNGEPYHFVGRMEHGDRLTNNQAEYMTLIAALKWLAQELGEARKDAKVEIFGDSKLVASQINGVWKVKNQNMIPLVREAKELFRQFGRCTIEWHPRAKSVERLGH